VKLLFDQNLSRHLVTRLAHLFPESSHVAALALETASDREVWDYAGSNDFAIVSKDSDFRQLAFLLGPPPKSIWLRVGNESTSAIARLLTDSVRDIEEFAESGESALLVLPGLDG
jgi:predicted nuclease of predicted toxin-antitoxin system